MSTLHCRFSVGLKIEYFHGLVIQYSKQSDNTPQRTVRCRLRLATKHLKYVLMFDKIKCVHWKRVKFNLVLDTAN